MMAIISYTQRGTNNPENNEPVHNVNEKLQSLNYWLSTFTSKKLFFHFMGKWESMVCKRRIPNNSALGLLYLFLFVLTALPLIADQLLKWCRKRQQWDFEWNEVVFSDESPFCLSIRDGCTRIRRCHRERHDPQFYMEKHIHCLW